MPETVETLAPEIAACRLCAGRFDVTHTAHRPKPVVWLSHRAPVLIASQAPGARAHASGVPFDDPSGDRLRAWLGVDRPTFYDRGNFAILPMAFCFPGYDRAGSDLPPPALCAATWRARALAAQPGVRLTLLIGGHAQRWHLRRAAPCVTATVEAWRSFGPEIIPLPHPSWRNTAWLKKHPWFETDLLPVLQARVSKLLAGG